MQQVGNAKPVSVLTIDTNLVFPFFMQQVGNEAGSQPVSVLTIDTNLVFPFFMQQVGNVSPTANMQSPRYPFRTHGRFPAQAALKRRASNTLTLSPLRIRGNPILSIPPRSVPPTRCDRPFPPRFDVGPTSELGCALLFKTVF
jgi:hypothetical protein